MSTQSKKEDVVKETVREETIHGRKCTFTKDKEYSFWSVKVGNYTLPPRFTTFPKATLGVEEYVNEQTKAKIKAA